MELESKINDFKMRKECINIERDEVTTLPNPQIKKLKKQQPKF